MSDEEKEDFKLAERINKIIQYNFKDDIKDDIFLVLEEIMRRENSKGLTATEQLIKNQYYIIEAEKEKHLKNIIEKQKKQIDLMAKTIKELNNKNEDVDCFIPREYSNINECVKKNSCEECIVEYFKQQRILKQINDLGENFKELAKEVFIKEGLFNNSDVEVYFGGKRLVKEVNKPDEPRQSD